VSLDFALTNYNYREIGDGRLGTAIGLLDTEKGSVPGFGISASLMRNWIVDNLYLRAEYQRLSGSTNYIGASLCPGGCAAAVISYPPYGSLLGKDGATTNNFDFRLGKGFAINNNLMITPFLGLGYSEWFRKVNLGEDYSYGYYGAGLLLQYSPISRLVFSASGLVGGTFGSHIDVKGNTVILSAARLGLVGFSGPLGNSTIVKLGISADYALTDHIHVNAGVDYTTFKFGESALYGSPLAPWEPRSETGLTTFKIGLGYSF